MNDAQPMKRRCKAKNRQGNRCSRAPIAGGYVCKLHGGASPNAQRKAAERLADLIDPDRALREAARIAYSDIRDLFDADGNLKPIKDWPDHAAAGVSAVEIVKKNLAAGDGQVDTVHKLKLWDKSKNLEMLFKHLGLLTEKITHDGEIAIKWQS